MKKEIGIRIQKIREEKGLNKEQFAKLIGISGQYLGMVEKGSSVLSVEKLKKLCDISGKSADYILFGISSPKDTAYQNLLKSYTIDQINSGCKTLQDLAVFIKSFN